MTPGRVKKIVEAYTGSLKVSGSTKEQYETTHKLVLNYELVTLELTSEKIDQNPALSIYDIPPSVVWR